MNNEKLNIIVPILLAAAAYWLAFETFMLKKRTEYQIELSKTQEILAIKPLLTITEGYKLTEQLEDTDGYLFNAMEMQKLGLYDQEPSSPHIITQSISFNRIILYVFSVNNTSLNNALLFNLFLFDPLKESVRYFIPYEGLTLIKGKDREICFIGNKLKKHQDIIEFIRITYGKGLKKIESMFDNNELKPYIIAIYRDIKANVIAMKGYIEEKEIKEHKFKHIIIKEILYS